MNLEKLYLPIILNISGKKSNLNIGIKCKTVDSNINPVIESVDNVPKPVSGILQARYGLVDIATKNCKISAYQNNVLIDYSYSDDEGNYKLYIGPGTYDFEISNQFFSRKIKNMKIEDGIKNQFYSRFIKGQIYKKIEDTIEFIKYDSNSFSIHPLKQISGIIIDQNGKPLHLAKIIILDEMGNIVTYQLTNKYGKYNFAIPNGKYEIMISHNEIGVKKVKYFDFLDNRGFFTKLSEENNNFKYLGDQLWILS